ncbi:hypothetical protein SAMN02745898_10951 [Streptomyces sp. 136MFCol5.1]|uniref:hypothetical protein n=1 Tax=Streptomyces sp. 136MFCol5.1 TaxID=1172182 RepID=UPI00088DE425|nr:hypothetical protein [Streptomyces sp. 136MFCol5.1]SCZ08805.1 hypothetical protein SAMN02745898_10951 [Streptomyces sp. 136MFCol5.1]
MTPLLLTSACLLTITLGYASLCAGSPFGDCRKCRGMGHQIKTDRKGRMKRGKDCRRCKASGKRIRVGRHLYNVAARLHRDGTR